MKHENKRCSWDYHKCFLFVNSIPVWYVIFSLYNKFSLYSPCSDRASESLEPYLKHSINTCLMKSSLTADFESRKISKSQNTRREYFLNTQEYFFMSKIGKRHFEFTMKHKTEH